MATQNAIVATGSKPNYFSTNLKAWINFNYEPQYSSEEALIEQTRLSLKTSMESSC
jgi:hypothetical protein